jgi:hypothetical protein
VVEVLRGTDRPVTPEALAECTGHGLRATLNAADALVGEGLLERTVSGRFRLSSR